MGEEKYQEWLERMDVPIEATGSIADLQAYLEDELLMEASEDQLGSLWDATKIRYEELAPAGVRPVSIEYSWGTELRWGVRGYPGLWGWEGMKETTGWEP